MQMDSPLSTIASVTGILTFVFAILAAVYVRFTYLRNADTEYFQVKASLSWFKTERLFIRDLIEGQGGVDGAVRGGRGRERENEMYSFVLEELGRLEERLLEVIAEAEEASQSSSQSGAGNEKGTPSKQTGWTLIPRHMRGRTDIALSWLPVRGKALELVRQREGLASRVLFVGLGVVGGRVRDQESFGMKREERFGERLEKLEGLVAEQHEKLDKLEGLLYRVMHRDRVGIVQEEDKKTKGGVRTEETEI